MSVFYRLLFESKNTQKTQKDIKKDEFNLIDWS